MKVRNKQGRMLRRLSVAATIFSVLVTTGILISGLYGFQAVTVARAGMARARETLAQTGAQGLGRGATLQAQNAGRKLVEAEVQLADVERQMEFRAVALASLLLLLAGGSWHLRSEIARKDEVQQQLGLLQERAAHLLENSPGAIYSLGLGDFRCTFVSANVRTLFGYQPQDFTENHGRWLSCLHPEDRSILSRDLALLFEGGSRVLEYRFQHKDGTYLWIQDVQRLVRDASGAPREIVGCATDVTPLKQSEQSLRLSQQWLKAAVQGARIGLWEFDPQTGRAYHSPEWKDIFGYAEHEMEDSHEEWERRLHPEDLQRVRKESREVVEGRRTETEYRALHRDGRYRWLLTRASALRDAEGKPSRVVGAILDVSDRKRDEATLLESQQRLQLAVQASNTGLWDWDLVSNKVQFSQEWKSQIGFADNEISDDYLEWETRLHPDDRATTVTRVQAYLERPWDDYESEFRLRHKDGSYRWVLARGRLLKDADGKPYRMLGSHLDITDRKDAEEALRKSEARYRNLVENAAYGIFRSSRDGRFLDANRALAAMLGYESVRELLAVNIFSIYVNPGERERLIQGLTEKRGRLQTVWKRKDGKPVTVQLAARVVEGRDGEPESFEVIVENLTERSLLEEQLRQAQKMEAVGQLAGGVAHDFNNLLSVIMGYSDLVLRRLAPDSPERKPVEQIRTAGERAARVTRQLLAFSRKQVLDVRYMSLNEVVADTAQMLGRLIGEDIKLSVAPAADLGTIKADPGQVEQILLNLAVNARDAMPHGGKLQVETVNVEMDADSESRHGLMAPGSYVMMAMSDTGEGMDAETQSHIFEPFFTTKPEGQGTGLGLATVYGIVKQSDGYIFVYSEPGHGTTFRIYFPRVEVNRHHDPMSATETRAVHGSGTILLVEDEESLRELGCEILRDAGYTVLECADPEDAIHVFAERKQEISLVLTDVVMPGMTGPELVSRLGRDGHEAKVLYVSGYPRDFVIKRAVLPAGTLLLQKPYSRSLLLSKVHEALQGG